MKNIWCILIIGVCSKAFGQNLVLTTDQKLYSALDNGIVINQADTNKNYWDENLFDFQLASPFTLSDDWVSFDRIWVSTDGYVLLTSNDNPDFFLHIAAFFTDLIDRRFYHPAFKSEMLLSTQDNMTVVEWKDVGSACDDFETDASEARFNFQVILDHENNAVNFHFGTMVSSADTDFCISWSDRPIIGVRFFTKDNNLPAWILDGNPDQPDLVSIYSEIEEDNFFLLDFPTSGRFYSIISETSSTSETVENKSLSIYPNPFVDKIMLKDYQALRNDEVTMYNILGKLVGVFKCDSGTIDGLGHLSPGVYILHVSNRIIKIVKK